MQDQHNTNTDIVERLRAFGTSDEPWFFDAADEIEHLRALITEFHNADLAELAAPPWEAEQTMRRRLDAENALYDAAERWSK